MIKFRQILSVLADSGLKECRLAIGPGNTTRMIGTSIKSGKLTDDNILEAIHDYPYQNITLSIDNSTIVFLKQEKKYII